MQHRILYLSLMLSAYAMGGPILSKEPASFGFLNETEAVDTTTAFDVEGAQGRAVESLPLSSSVSLKEMAAAALIVPEPAAYGITAAALLTIGMAGHGRRRNR
jgi:MprA protease rhombosortase-interaction domain-containing protein